MTISIDVFNDSSDPILTVLSHGMGQDSTSILEKYINDSGFRATYAPHHFLVIMSDTGNEYDETYEHVERTKKRCLEHGIEFVFLTADMGFHSEGWRTLQGAFERYGTVGSKAYPKICSQRLKIDPIYRFLEHYIGERYGVKTGKKKGFREFASRFGKIRVILGIAAKEEGRMSDPSKRPERWYRDSIEHCYPMVAEGIDRKKAQEYIASVGQVVPPPSNCKMCPWLSLEELEYLARFYPADLEEWVNIEARKIEKFADKSRVPVVNAETGEITKYENKNFGVWGVTLLPEKIKEAAKKFAEWTDAEIENYRFSHGHCSKTKF